MTTLSMLADIQLDHEPAGTWRWTVTYLHGMVRSGQATSRGAAERAAHQALDALVGRLRAA